MSQVTVQVKRKDQAFRVKTTQKHTAQRGPREAVLVTALIAKAHAVVQSAKNVSRFPG